MRLFRVLHRGAHSRARLAVVTVLALCATELLASPAQLQSLQSTGTPQSTSSPPDPGQKPETPPQFPSPSAQLPEPPIKNPDVQPAPKPSQAPPTLTIPRLQRPPALEDFLSMQPQGEVALANGEGHRLHPAQSARRRKRLRAHRRLPRLRPEKSLRRLRLLRRSEESARPHVAPRRYLRRRSGRDHARHLSRPPPRLRFSDHAARRAMGRDLDRGFARRANRRAFRHVIRHGVGFARQSDRERLRRMDGDSFQEPALSRDQASRSGE